MNFLETQTQAEETPVGNKYGKTVSGETPAGQYYLVEDAGEIIKKDPFDPSFIPAIFKPFHVEVDKMAQAVQSLKVTDWESNNKAVLYKNQAQQLVSALSKTTKKAGEKYKRITDCLADENEALAGRLIGMQKILESDIKAFLLVEERKRKEAERKAKEAAAKIQAEFDEKARLEREQAAKEAREKAEAEGLTKKQAEEAAQQAAAMVEDAPVVVMDAPAENKVVTEAGSAKLKEDWTFEIINPMLLPEAAFVNRKDQVIAALKPWVSNEVKNGVREMPGVKIFKAAKLETRAKSRGNSKGEW